MERVISVKTLADWHLEVVVTDGIRGLARYGIGFLGLFSRH
jgi:hypothetical protein